MNKRMRTLAAVIAAILSLSTLTLGGCAAHYDAEYDAECVDEYYYNDPGMFTDQYVTDSSNYGMYNASGNYAWNTEEYNHIDENGFVSVLANPYSTFGVDVDTASYTNMRRMIQDGMMPDPDSIRIEELINYFTYDYPEPRLGKPFSVTCEMSDCPWNPDTKLMMIGLQTEKLDKEDMPDSNIVFLIDVSGSMNSSDKLPLVQDAFALLTEQLDENDRVSIVTYASNDSVVLRGESGENKSKILRAVNNLQAGGSTYGSAGINTAYEIAEEYFIKGGNNRVILATDGDLNVGVTSEAELTRLIESKRDKGIYLSVLGFGTGNLKDNKMEALADNGNGNYAYIDSLSEARRVLIDELCGTLFTVAKDVKLQVQFNPETVRGYRLIGYENRIMAAEDFSDDAKDGGEIGAGHRVTVLYEIVDKDSAYEINEPESAYYNYSENNSDDYLTLSIRYKEPDGDESKLLTYPIGKTAYSRRMSGNLRLASAVAEVGMLLRESPYSGTASFDSALMLLDNCNGLPDSDKAYDFYNLVFWLCKFGD